MMPRVSFPQPVRDVARKEAMAMHEVVVTFAYMAPQPYLPMTSVLAVTGGLILLFGRRLIGMLARWARPATIRRTRG
jgi:hypothetical protein